MEQTKVSLYIFLNCRQVDRTSNCEEITVHLKIRCVQVKLKNNPKWCNIQIYWKCRRYSNLLEVKLLLSGGFSSFIWRVLVFYMGSKCEVTSTFKPEYLEGLTLNTSKFSNLKLKSWLVYWKIHRVYKHIHQLRVLYQSSVCCSAAFVALTF